MKQRLRRFAVPLLFALLISGLTGTAAIAQGLEPLADECTDAPLAGLEIHNGFQVSPRCVDTEFGAVPEQGKNATLLIVNPPDKLKPGEGFRLEISSRNLTRDRFLAAGQGGYYLESALLNEQGVTRGHIHVACRNVGEEAPPPDRSPFFRAIEDGGGGVGVSRVSVDIPGSVVQTGELQCAAWAGDGSHRTPMMTFANQIPAFDAVTIRVKS